MANYAITTYQALNWKQILIENNVVESTEAKGHQTIIFEAESTFEALKYAWDKAFGGELPTYKDNHSGYWYSDGDRAGLEDRASEIGIEVQTEAAYRAIHEDNA